MKRGFLSLFVRLFYIFGCLKYIFFKSILLTIYLCHVIGIIIFKRSMYHVHFSSVLILLSLCLYLNCQLADKRGIGEGEGRTNSLICWYFNPFYQSHLPPFYFLILSPLPPPLLLPFCPFVAPPLPEGEFKICLVSRI